MCAALPADAAKTFKEAKPGLPALPIEQIEKEVKQTGAQLDDLDRLEAMQTRLKAMIDAAKTVKPALDRFYTSLNNDRKARFNRLGHELARAK